MTSLTHEPPASLLFPPRPEQKGAKALLEARNERKESVRSVASGGGLGNPQVIRPLEIQKRQKARAKRYSTRESMRNFTHLKRLRACGHTAVNGAGVMIRCTSTATGKVAGFAGVSTCGSVWACPVCAAKISARRSEELSQTLKYAAKNGYHAAMMTFTVRHRKEQSLKKVWGAVSKGWDRVVSGKKWKSDKEKHGVKGYVRAVEVTHGSNGWHVHVHTVVIFNGSEENALELGLGMWKRWQSGIESQGFTALEESGGFDVQILKGDMGAIGRYLAKQADALAQEATLGAFKEGQKKNRTPFQIAQLFAETGDLADLEIWHEWERVSKGKKQLTWSRGLRDWAHLQEEQTDEDIASEELGSSVDDLVLLPGETWAVVRSSAWKLLDMAESGGKDKIVSWLDSKSLLWKPPPTGCLSDGESVPAEMIRRAKPEALELS